MTVLLQTWTFHERRHIVFPPVALPAAAAAVVLLRYLMGYGAHGDFLSVLATPQHSFIHITDLHAHRLSHPRRMSVVP